MTRGEASLTWVPKETTLTKILQHLPLPQEWGLHHLALTRVWDRTGVLLFSLRVATTNAPVDPRSPQSTSRAVSRMYTQSPKNGSSDNINGSCCAQTPYTLTSREAMRRLEEVKGGDERRWLRSRDRQGDRLRSWDRREGAVVYEATLCE